MHSDLSELDLPKGASIRFPHGDDKIMNFELILKPDDGLYKGGAFLFTFSVPMGYPHEPPKVKCMTKVFHPNIDLDGNICLNILREDWKPVLTISSVVFGLNFLFIVSSRNAACRWIRCHVVKCDVTHCFLVNVPSTMNPFFVRLSKGGKRSTLVVVFLEAI